MAARVLSSQLPELTGKPVHLEGWVHRIRDLGGVRFLILRDRGGFAQVVLPPGLELGGVACEWVVAVDGTVRREPRAPGGQEVGAERLSAICPAETPPLEVFKPLSASDLRLETLLEHRAVSLRIPEILDVWRIAAEVLRSFRAYLTGEGFTEICSPKLVLAGAEGGAAVFGVDYFGGRAFLAQSPQFYKQIMVGSGLERVFEVGHAYRAEKSETSRHITEFVGLDFEMGFVSSPSDVMAMLSRLIAAIFQGVSERFDSVLARRGVSLPQLREIPAVSFDEAKRILANRYGKTEGLNGDLDTEGERLMGEWAREELGSDLLFVTGYALGKRPVYTMPDPAKAGASASFDLLYHGVEIVTGGQRIHEHDRLAEAIQRHGLDPADYAGYLEAFRHGMPPHGGMGMGLERLVKQMLGLANIKQACLFPRDRHRLAP
jgi:nondiscriminating aspartyl-tRNA synthetase